MSDSPWSRLYEAPSPTTSPSSSRSPRSPRRRNSSTVILLDKVVRGEMGDDRKMGDSSRLDKTRAQRGIAILLLIGLCLLLLQQYYNLSLSSSATSWLSDLPSFPFAAPFSARDIEEVDLLRGADVDLSPSRGASRLDEMCETRSCSFLFPIRIGEQETKAQQHLYQLGLLARALDRILVLPRSRKSRFGACLLHPFDYYYQQDSLDNLGIPTVLQWEWEDWMAKRRGKEVQLVQFRTAKEGHEGISGKLMGEEAQEEAWGRANCLQEQGITFGDRRIDIKASTKYSTKLADRDDFARLVIAGLAPEEHQSTLAVDYDLRHPFLSPSLFTSAPRPLPFAFFPLQSHYTNLASSLASQLGSFIAIHWRIETLPLERLPACASSLVDHLVRLKRVNPSLSSVYLATDYPIDSLLEGRHAGSEAHSGTFTKSLTAGHEQMMRRFLEEFDSAARTMGLSLTTFAKEAARLEHSFLDDAEAMSDSSDTPSLGLSTLGALLRDSATSSIVDLLVAQQAEIFLAGLPTTPFTITRGCGKDSSFTMRIINARREREKTAGRPVSDEFAVRYFEADHGDVLGEDAG